MVTETEDLMFSVEVTTYNQKDYIAQTLQSIIDQKHNYKYEIVISDDCSKDGTQDVIRQFHEKYPDIIKPVYNEKNLGAMQNYYATVSRAKGKYLMECSGDDYWLPGKVEKQIEFMERNLDFAVCYGKADILHVNENRIESDYGSNYKDFKEILTKGNSCPALTLCIRRDFFCKYLDEIKPQDRSDWLMEDYPFLVYTAFESLIHFIDMPMAVYRSIENSLSHQMDIEKMLRFKKSGYDIQEFFADRYSVTTEKWDEQKMRKELLSNNENSSFPLVRKIMKFLMPYWVLKLAKKV